MAELLDVSTEPVKPAQTNAPVTEPSGWMPLSEEARNTAPESVKALLEAKKWSTAEQIATGYADLEKVLGRGEHIFKPESPDDADGWTKYWQQLGVPEESEYEYEADEAVPFDDAIIDRFRKFSKEIHLNKEQSSGLVKFQRDIIKEVMASDAQAEEEAVATSEAEKEIIRKALVQRCGGEVAYQNQIIEARQTADELGIFQVAEKLKISKEPEFIGMLMDISERVTEGIITKGEPPLNTVKEPLAELEELKKNEAYTSRFHPQHKAVVTRVNELCAIIANSGQAPKRIQDG